jgi:hypothetical protein
LSSSPPVTSNAESFTPPVASTRITATRRSTGRGCALTSETEPVA